MGNKINVKGYRIGVTKDWESKWFYDNKDYGKYVLEDSKIRDFFRKKLPTAGIETIIIERSLNEVKVTLKTSRPGVVIGRKGAGVNILKEDLSKLIEGKISISVEEVKRPESSAALIADSIVHQIEKRIHYRRAIMSALSKATDQGVRGCKIVVSGVLGGANSIARSEPYIEGSIPVSTIKADIDYAKKSAVTSWGMIGVRVWVYK